MIKDRVARSKAITSSFYVDTIEKSGGSETLYTQIQGPVSIYRFGRINFGEAQCWFTQDLLLEATAFARISSENQGHFGDSIRFYIRNKTAVCLDWNDFCRFSAMHVPPNVMLPAFTSIIKGQPKISLEEVRRVHKAKDHVTTSMLHGGAVQYWLWPVPDWIDLKPSFLKENIGL